MSIYTQFNAQISQSLCQDQFKLSQQARRIKDEQDPRFASWHARLSASCEKAMQRTQGLPSLSYPENLPVVEQKQAILEAIRDNQVVIVAGETGSGKTTQLPKICMELGLGGQGLIGHTQPRRLAARSVAARIAEETQSELGDLVGYKIRFQDQIKPSSVVKLMTDGMLLAEMQQDRYLSQYQVIIIDEAHERSLNIDFLLGLLKGLLPKRPDLKLIITSATIDPARFSRHFNNAPMISVEGRTYPVETRYRPLDEFGDGDVLEGISLAVDELYREKRGDILIFLNGEREIRDTAEFLRRRQLPHTEILPLFSRLSNAEQNRIFAPSTGRRIVLATNVAETSLTVPGIRYVIDPGTARISRYSVRAKVQRLPIEAISQASANQRKGRCGRVAEGICIRLYSEQDFVSRSEFTDPEIVRTNLASVMLQMLALGLGDIESFPFIDAPDQRNIKDGLNLLEELGALSLNSSERKLSAMGRKLAVFPVDPRLGRMLLAAEGLGSLHEVMVICAALSIQDPRERPLDKQQQADEAHRRFADKDSDFIAYVNLWNYLKEQQQALSSSQFRKLCSKEYLAYMRLREWQDIYTQLHQVIRELGFKLNKEAADNDAIHQAITAGLLSQFGFRDKEREFLGARNTRFIVFPGSSQAKKPPKWVVASELVETSRLFARNAAKIQPQWLEQLASHLVNLSYSEPHWSVKQQAVMAYQSQRLYGVTIVNRRLVNYGKVDPKVSREVFIRSALVEGQWRNQHAFFKHNQALLDDVEQLEEKQRRRDIRVDDQVLFDFYDGHLPADIVSVSHFNRWWKNTQQKTPKLLHFDDELVRSHEASNITARSYPDVWQMGQLALPLSYVFDPAALDDGVSVHVPLALLNQLDYSAFEWQIPALREELLVALIKSLTKALRRNFVPAPNFAKAALQSMGEPQGRLVEQFARQLLRMTGARVENDDWDWQAVPAHLRVNFKVIDEAGKVLAQGRDIQVLQTQLQSELEQALAELTPATNVEQTQLEDWSFDHLPEEITEERRGYRLTAYPALVDEGKHAAVRLFDKADEAAWHQSRGLSKLVQLRIPSPLKYLQQHLPNKAKLGLYFNPFGKVEMLIDDCALAVIDAMSAQHAVRDKAAFEQLVEQVRGDLSEHTLELAKQVEQILSLHYQLSKKLKGKVNFDVVLSHSDIKAQLASLIYPGFVRKTGAAKLSHLKRYLQGVEKRLEKLATDAHKDRLALQQIQQAEQAIDGLKLLEFDGCKAELHEMLQELRVSLFAQQLGTQYPISLKRLLNRVEQIRKERN